MISSLLYNFNHASFWRGEMKVWDRRIGAASFDRLLYLALHRSGWMGKGEARLLQKLVQPGMRVVDVGANVGLYSLHLSRLAGKHGSVLAFEPEPKLHAMLVGNCARNRADNVTVLQRALGARNGTARLRRSPFNSGDNRLAENGAVRVEVVRFDDLGVTVPLHFVKVDVQGYELDVLRGMENALAASPEARVLFEFCPSAVHSAGSSAEALLEFFRARGFRLYQTNDAFLKPVADSARLLAATLGHRYLNLLATRSALDV